MFSGNTPIPGKCHEIIFQVPDHFSTKETQALSSPTASPLGSSPVYTNCVILLVGFLAWRIIDIIMGIISLWALHCYAFLAFFLSNVCRKILGEALRAGLLLLLSGISRKNLIWFHCLLLFCPSWFTQLILRATVAY